MWSTCPFPFSFRSSTSYSFHPSVSFSLGFYYGIQISHYAGPSRVTGNSITLEDALIFESEATRFVSSDHLTDQRQAVQEETHILTFAELKALIEQGKTDGIPNNKLIPNILSVSSSTPPSLSLFPSPLESTWPALSLRCSRTLPQMRTPDR